MMHTGTLILVSFLALALVVEIGKRSRAPRWTQRFQRKSWTPSNDLCNRLDVED